MLLTNDAESGTNGTTVTAANSGFDVVNIGAGSTLVFDNSYSAGTGSLCYSYSAGTTPSFDLEWTTSITSAVTTVYFRLYVLAASLPSANVRLATIRGAGANRATIQLTTTGAVRINNSAGSQVVISGVTATAGSAFRIEGFITGSATVGQIELKTFLSPDSTTASDTQTSTATQNTGGTIDQWWWGDHAGTAGISYKIDGMGISDTGYIGPLPTNTNVSLSDTGSGADALSATAAVPIADTGSGADTLSASVTLSLADTGSGADVLLVNKGSDPNQAWPGVAPMFFAPSRVAFQLNGDSSAAQTSAFGLADTGSLLDALTATVAASLADTTTGTDAISVSVTPFGTGDTGSGADALALTISVPLPDTGTFTDGLSVFTGGNPSLVETCTATDSLTITVTLPTLTELGSFVDNWSVSGPGVLAAHYLYTPPTWRHVNQMESALRVGVQTCTLVYRSGGVWYNQFQAYPGGPDLTTVDTDAASGLLLFFYTPTVIPGSLYNALAALTQADPSWTAASFVALP